MSTWIELAARAIKPETATDEQLDSLLWSCSPFPFTGPLGVFRTLRKTWIAGGRTFGGAMQYAEDELDRAMREINENESGGRVE